MADAICKRFGGLDRDVPTSSTMMLHNFDHLCARVGAVSGSLKLTTTANGYETFDLVLFTGNHEFASDLAAAISAVVEKHAAITNPLPAEVADAA